MVSRLDVFDVGAVFGIRPAAQCRPVGEAQEEESRFRLLDRDGQAAAGVGRRGIDFEANPVRFGQRDAVPNRRRAEIELAQQRAGMTFDDDARLQSGQEGKRVFDTVEQTLPDLLPAERRDQRVLRIVDLDQVLEIHAAMLTSAP